MGILLREAILKYLFFSLVIFFTSFGSASEYLLIKNGTVVNRIVADSVFADSISGDFDFVIEVKQSNREAGLGWDYDNGVLGVGSTLMPPVRPVIPETPEEAASRGKREDRTQLKVKIKGLCQAEADGLLKDICQLVGE